MITVDKAVAFIPDNASIYIEKELPRMSGDAQRRTEYRNPGGTGSGCCCDNSDASEIAGPC